MELIIVLSIIAIVMFAYICVLIDMMIDSEILSGSICRIVFHDGPRGSTHGNFEVVYNLDGENHILETLTSYEVTKFFDIKHYFKRKYTYVSKPVHIYYRETYRKDYVVRRAQIKEYAWMQLVVPIIAFLACVVGCILIAVFLL